MAATTQGGWVVRVDLRTPTPDSVRTPERHTQEGRRNAPDTDGKLCNPIPRCHPVC